MKKKRKKVGVLLIAALMFAISSNCFARESSLSKTTATIGYVAFGAGVGLGIYDTNRSYDIRDKAGMWVGIAITLLSLRALQYIYADQHSAGVRVSF